MHTFGLLECRNDYMVSLEFHLFKKPYITPSLEYHTRITRK